MRAPQATRTPERRRRVPVPASRVGLAVTGLALCVALVIGMTFPVVRKIDEFSTAASDNAQYSLSQAEVEFLRYRLAISQADADRDRLDALRRRFDIFYSRMTTVERGSVFAALRANPKFEAPRAAIEAHFADTVPLIDGPDDALAAALPALTERADKTGEAVRAMTLEGLAAFAQISDERREGLVRTLAVLALVLAVLFGGLVLVAVSLYRLMRQSTQRARAVQEGAARTRTIVETSLDAILVFDATGTILSVNGTARDLFRLGETQMGLPLALLFDAAGDDASREGPLGFLSRGTAPALQERRFEATGRDLDGRRFPVEMSVGRADDTAEAIYVAYMRDITRRKTDEHALTEARDRALAGERAKSEFVAVMSHEMRTPLNGLLGSLQLLRDHSLTERQTELVDRMEGSGRLLLGLVNDVLDLAKFEAGKMDVTPHAMSVTRLLDGVLETVAALAAEHGNRIEWTWVGPPRDACTGDQRRLRQVLLNLVGNAVKFTRGGLITVEAEALPDGRSLEVRVIDTGIGIAEADLDRIFNDFETLDSSYARQVGGTGLGLGIARRMVHLMGGEIGAESEPGEGSLFWIRVPVGPVPAEKAETLAAPAPPAVRPLPPLDLLLVEDNPLNRAVAREMLEGDGHRVTEAHDGRAGVDWARSRRFDAILMDISMPVMDGIAAAREIARDGGASRGAPILAVTAHALAEEVEGFRAAGMAGAVSKPIDRTELTAALSAVLTPDTRVPSTRSASMGPVPAARAPLVDKDHLASVWRDLPEAARDRLVAGALEETSRTVTAVAAAPDRPTEPEGLREDIHRSAGSCAALGLTAMRTALAEIEDTLKRNGSVPPSLREALPGLWAETRTELEAWRAEA
ncbi:ATP-binding protein [Roseivivax marinus]|uniref:ATP-binding protein n=1 Tax=Roseivivax marinus TaxID=1379903 RepID=UPI000688A352|nr:ATP-binding protein [Roseivivax marinus]